jgi:hypothetical protein
MTITINDLYSVICEAKNTVNRVDYLEEIYKENRREIENLKAKIIEQRRNLTEEIQQRNSIIQKLVEQHPEFHKYDCPECKGSGAVPGCEVDDYGNQIEIYDTCVNCHGVGIIIPKII